MIFAKGTFLPDSHLPGVLSALAEEINHTRARLTLEPETVIAAIEGLTQRLDRGELDALLTQYATPQMLAALDDIRPALSRAALEEKLRTELGPFGPAGTDRIDSKRYPLGTLFHVTAGNVAGLPAFSAVEGLLTGNINLIKLPRGDKGLTLAILSQLVEQEPRLAPFLYAFDVPSSDKTTMQALADLADGMVVWGGDDAVRACRAMAPVGCKLMEWGHRLSFAYLSHYEDNPEELDALAHHIIATGGLLCSSCQVIYLDTEDFSQAAQFCQDFLPRLSHAAQNIHPTPGKAAEAALYAYETILEQVVDRKNSGDQVFHGIGCTITLRRDQALELSHLHGNVLVKCLPRQMLAATLYPQRGRLQTAGLICPDEERTALTALLARAGVNRVTRAGHMSHTFPGEGHDGEYPLRRYQRMVDVEG